MQVDHVMMQGGDLSNILYMSGEPDLACFPRFENLHVGSSSADLLDYDAGQVTPDSILEDPTRHYHESSGVSGGSSNGGRHARRASVGTDQAAGAASDVPRKKKSGGFFPQIVLSLNNRRKGAPHRSPFA
jgi:hypothetical protein